MSRQQSKKPLPPLEVGQAYLATEFQGFEFEAAKINGTQSILRLHLKNGTSIDLPVEPAHAEKLLANLMIAYPQHAEKIYRQYFSSGG